MWVKNVLLSHFIYYWRVLSIFVNFVLHIFYAILMIFTTFFCLFFDLLIYTNPTILLEAMLKTRYFTCRRMMHQSCSIVQNLVVNYHLVISYPQQCHIRININHRYVIIIASHVTFCIFSSRTLNNFYKLLVIIVIYNEEQTNWP